MRQRQSSNMTCEYSHHVSQTYCWLWNPALRESECCVLTVSMCLRCVCTVCSGLYTFECVCVRVCFCVHSSVWSSVLKHKEARYCSSPRDATEIDGIHTLCILPPPPPFKLPAPPIPLHTQTHYHHFLTDSHTHTPTSLFLSLIISCGHEPK